jgi:hypothetical protein
VETHPIFRGKLDPDISFFGFPFTKDQAKGNGTASLPGFFFVIQEHPSEPSFGVASGSGALAQPAGDAAATAKALLQRPVRLAIHGQDLLKG